MSFAYMWLVLLAVSAAACFYPVKKPGFLNARFFLLVLTIFVLQALWLSSNQRQTARLEPALDIDNAELVCKLNEAMNYLHGKLVHTVGSSMDTGRALGAKQLSRFENGDFLSDAVKLLEKQLGKSPDSVLTEAKLIVVLGERGLKSDRRQLTMLVNKFLARHELKQKQLGRVLQAIYLKHSVPAAESSPDAAVIEGFYPPGWYRQSALIKLYEASGQSRQMQALKTRQVDACVGLMLNMLKLLLLALSAGAFGLLVILLQLFTLPRKLGKPQDEGRGPEAPVWSGLTVYGVFVGWLAVQLIVGSFLQMLMKHTGIMGQGPLTEALATAVVYFCCNVPGLWLIYYFACRRNQVSFASSLWLRLKSGNLGAVRLVLIGFCAWCAALPIVALASYIAMKYFGAQGSSNPVLTLVLDVARSSDWRATAIFYFTLGVMAPLCEETLFRGFLYRSLRKRLGVGTSLLASAAAFAAVHLDSGAVIQLFCLGLVFGFVFERTRSLIPAMVAHGLWNSGTFTLVLVLLGS